MLTMRTTLTTAAAALLLLGSGAPLSAQNAPPPVPSATTLSLPIIFTGEVRSRTEWDAPGGAAAADLFSMLRARARRDARRSPPRARRSCAERCAVVRLHERRRIRPA